MSNERGFSLIELMVSVALGLVISLAATQLFLVNQVSLNYQRGMTDVQVSGRYVLDNIATEVRQAGLPDASMAPLAGVAMLAVDLPTTTPYLIRNGSATAASISGLITDSDQLVVQRFSIDADFDCEGNAVAAGAYVVTRYFVRMDTDTNTPALACDAGRRTDTATTAYGDDGVVLMPGVESFQVMYGVRDLAGAATRYMNAATLAAASPRPTVVSVRIALYARSQERAGEPLPPASDIAVLDTTIAAGATQLADGRIHRLFMTSVAVRN